MFDNMFWAVYWIDVLSESPALFIVPGILLVVGAVGTMIYNAECRPGNETTYTRVLWPTFFVGLLVALLIMFVPSQRTMYMMLGVKTTENVVESPLGKKLQQIIDAEVDGYLKKLNQKKD